MARIYAAIKSGTYAGDGTTSLAITGLGFQPIYLKITRRDTATGTNISIIETWEDVIDDNANGQALLHNNVAANEHETLTDGIKSFDTDGFTVGDNSADADPNSNGITYNYIAFG